VTKNNETKNAQRRNASERTGGQIWPVDVRVALARSVVEQGLSARQVAGQLGVPYTTAVEWVKRYRKSGAAALEPAPRTGRPRPSSSGGARKAAILSTKAAQPQAGSRRIRDVMKRFLGIGASATTVRRVLKAEGVSERRPTAKPRAKPAPKRFERAEPNQLWQSDLFTFLLRRHERLYVAAFLDDHSRYLVSLSMAHHQRSTLVLEALAQGIAQYGSPREILTDQGRQYTAWRGSTEFEAELRRHGIEHVKSRPHHPQTCGKIERFWKTLWEELLSRTVFADFEDCQRRVQLFVQHYNFQRPHQALEGLTPADRFFRSATPVREAIEATVADNALRLAREQPPRKPFYLVGRLGDRDLSISTSGNAVKVRVGDEETMIPFSKESDDEHELRSSRGPGAASAARSSDTAVADAVEPGSHRAQPLAAGVVGAVGGEVGDGGDCASQDLPRSLLPTGDPGVVGDALGAEPGGRVEQRGAAVSRDDAHRAAAGAGGAARASEAARAALAAADAQVDSRPGEDAAPRPVAERLGSAADAPWREPLAALDNETPEERRAELDAVWRTLALKWQRKLCAANAPAQREENADERTPTQLHTHAERAAGGDSATRSDRGSARGDQERVGGGALLAPVAQSLPVDLAPHCARDGRVDRDQAGRSASSIERGGDAASTTEALAARQHASDSASRLDSPTPRGGRGPSAGADPCHSTPDADSQELGHEP